LNDQSMERSLMKRRFGFILVMAVSIALSLKAQTNCVELGFKGSWPGIVFPADLDVANGYAYVADGAADMTVLDVSNPASPVWVSSFVTNAGSPIYGIPGAPASALQVVGNLAYITDNMDGLHIVDVSDRTNLVLLSSTVVGAQTIQVSGSSAYVGSVLPGAQAPALGLTILDVSNPQNPQRISSLELSNTLFVADAVGNFAYLAIGAGLEVFDVTDSSNPALVGHFAGGSDLQAVQVVNNLAYLAAGTDGLLVVDVTVASAPVQLAAYPTGGSAADVRVVNGYAYVADMVQGLLVVDVSNPVHRTRWAAIRAPVAGVSESRAITLTLRVRMLDWRYCRSWSFPALTSFLGLGTSLFSPGKAPWACASNAARCSLTPPGRRFQAPTARARSRCQSPPNRNSFA
jgi:hypothetical protein